ncbi:MAG: hypothetical protein IJI45_08575 [Anaerolineaceae bacterium]|nr:hypothetical protein [Anaerolineaceae bacterium]
MKTIHEQPVRLPLSVRQLPVTETDYPIAGAARLETVINLDDYGYVEEEYLLKGEASIYSWPKEEPIPLVQTESTPYCTRILVRKPKDTGIFSGVVAMECFNGSFKIDHQNAGWGLNHEHIMESGDAWVGFTKDYGCMDSLHKLNPERYGDIGFPNPKPPEEVKGNGWDPLFSYWEEHNMPFELLLSPQYERGIGYEVTYQIAALLKRCEPGDPFFGYAVKDVVAFGINDYNTHISALHPYLRMPDKKPVIDGYLMYMSGEGCALNNEEDCFRFDDPRCKRTCDVPIIKVETSGDLLGILPHPFWAVLWRCEDSDEPGKQMRWYEIPGLGVRACFRQDKSFFACQEDYDKIGEVNIYRTEYWNQMTWMIVSAAYRNLKDWINGVIPPRADRIQVSGEYPNFRILADEYGNHLGGIRHPYLEVPIAVFGEDSSITFFDKSLRDKLYSSKEDYVEKVRECALQMVKDRWLLPRAVDALVEQAESIQWN